MTDSDGSEDINENILDIIGDGEDDKDIDLALKQLKNEEKNESKFI